MKELILNTVALWFFLGIIAFLAIDIIEEQIEKWYEDNEK